jgi:hypothetical protein
MNREVKIMPDAKGIEFDCYAVRTYYLLGTTLCSTIFQDVVPAGGAYCCDIGYGDEGFASYETVMRCPHSVPINNSHRAFQSTCSHYMETSDQRPACDHIFNDISVVKYSLAALAEQITEKYRDAEPRIISTKPRGSIRMNGRDGCRIVTVSPFDTLETSIFREELRRRSVR